MVYANRFAKPHVTVTARPIILPHPGKVDLRDRYNEVLNVLIEAIGVQPQCWDPRHGFWGPGDTIDLFRKNLDREGLFTWLSSMFQFEKEDRGVGWESPLLEIVLGFEEIVERIFRAPGHKAKISPICFAADLQGPVEAVERIEREMENASVFTFLSCLKRETELLDGAMVLTFRGGKPWIGIRKGLEILSFFSIPFLPKGPHGEVLALPIEEEWERYVL